VNLCQNILIASVGSTYVLSVSVPMQRLILRLLWCVSYRKRLNDLVMCLFDT
jgi:hypothetical protein